MSNPCFCKSCKEFIKPAEEIVKIYSVSEEEHHYWHQACWRHGAPRAIGKPTTHHASMQ